MAEKARAKERRTAAAAVLARRLRLRWDIEGHRASRGDVPLEQVLTSALLDDAAAALLPPPATAAHLRPAAAGVMADSRHVRTPLATLVPLELHVENRTSVPCALTISITCTDQAATDSLGHQGGVLHAGAIRNVALHVPPLASTCHMFGLCAMQPGRFSVAASVTNAASSSLQPSLPPPAPLCVMPIYLEAYP